MQPKFNTHDLAFRMLELSMKLMIGRLNFCKTARGKFKKKNMVDTWVQLRNVSKYKCSKSPKLDKKKISNLQLFRFGVVEQNSTWSLAVSVHPFANVMCCAFCKLFHLPQF